MPNLEILQGNGKSSQILEKVLIILSSSKHNEIYFNGSLIFAIWTVFIENRAKILIIYKLTL